MIHSFKSVNPILNRPCGYLVNTGVMLYIIRFFLIRIGKKCNDSELC